MDLINLNEELFQRTALYTILAPLLWNIIARSEYHYKPLRRLFSGNRYAACYAITAWVFSFSCYRDYIFHLMLKEQPKLPALDNLTVYAIGVSFVLLGQIFVWTSAYRLGITGTFLGDYCGILMKERVTGFPFNVLEHPMYVGSSMSFLGTSLMNASPAGLALTVLIYVVYMIASVFFEGPFTAMIYENAAKQQK